MTPELISTDTVNEFAAFLHETITAPDALCRQIKLITSRFNNRHTAAHRVPL